MTVKELFLYVGFDNVLNALRNTHRTCRLIKSIASYKEAFDTICLTEFEGAGGEELLIVAYTSDATHLAIEEEHHLR